MVTLALVGLGQWGINFLKTVESMEECQIKYLVSKTEVSLSRFSNEYIKTTNYKDLLNYSDIDGIIVATPGPTHFKIIKELMSSRHPMLVEKPFTVSYKDAIYLKKALKNKESKIMVGHTYLYNPAYAKVKKIIPVIGKIRYITFKLYNYGAFIDDMSSLWQLAPHGISLCLDILNQVPEEVSAWEIKTLRPHTSLNDNFCMMLKFKGEVTCILECGWLFPVKRRELIIYGTKSTIVFDDLADKKIILFKNLGPAVEGERVSGQQPKLSYPDYDSDTPLKRELEEFIKIIRSERKSNTSLEKGVCVTAVIDAAQRSLMDNGTSIRIKL